MSFLRVLLIISFFFALHFFAAAQFSDKRARFHSVGVHIMGSYFNGDVASGPNTIRPCIGAQYMYKFAPGFSFATGINYVKIAGDDESNSSPSNPTTANIYIRNLSFRNNMVEVFSQVRWDLFSSNDHYRKRPSYNIFAGIGLGLLYTNPQAKDSLGHWTDLRPLKTEGVSYSQYTGFIPVSIGMRYKISSNIDIEFEVTYRYSFSDYLDDVKGNYADPKNLSPKAAYFANRSAEPINTFNNHSRDLNYIQNQLGYPIQTNSGGQYVAGTGPGQSRGSKIGPDGYVLAMLRFVYIIPEKGVSCPRYRD